jgi:hypothetical protein
VTLCVAKSDLEGDGVFAAVGYGPRDHIAPMFWLLDTGNVDIQWPRDLRLSEVCWKVNHLSHPNCKLVTDGHKWTLVARRSIEPGEELTINYTRLPPFMDRNIEGYIERHKPTYRNADQNDSSGVSGSSS